MKAVYTEDSLIILPPGVVFGIQEITPADDASSDASLVMRGLRDLLGEDYDRHDDETAAYEAGYRWQLSVGPLVDEVVPLLRFREKRHAVLRATKVEFSQYDDDKPK